MTDVREVPPSPPFRLTKGFNGGKTREKEQHKQETANRLAVPSKKVSERRRRRRRRVFVRQTKSNLPR